VQSRYCNERSNRERERERKGETDRDRQRQRDKNRLTKNYRKKDTVRLKQCTRHAKKLRRNKK
jgi:hypothetical protein